MFARAGGLQLLTHRIAFKAKLFASFAFAHPATHLELMGGLLGPSRHLLQRVAHCLACMGCTAGGSAAAGGATRLVSQVARALGLLLHICTWRQVNRQGLV